MCTLVRPLVHTRAPRSHSRRKAFTKGEPRPQIFTASPSFLLPSQRRVLLRSLINYKSLNHLRLSVSSSPRLPRSPLSSFSFSRTARDARRSRDTWRQELIHRARFAPRRVLHLINVIRGLMDDSRGEGRLQPTASGELKLRMRECSSSRVSARDVGVRGWDVVAGISNFG